CKNIASRLWLRYLINPAPLDTAARPDSDILGTILFGEPNLAIPIVLLITVSPHCLIVESGRPRPMCGIIRIGGTRIINDILCDTVSPTRTNLMIIGHHLNPVNARSGRISTVWHVDYVNKCPNLECTTLCLICL